MAVTLEQLLGTQIPEKVMTYSHTDLILYALGIGLGADPLDVAQLRFVYEKELLVLPTAMVVLPYGRIADMNLGLDYLRLVHGEQWLTIHKLPPASGTVIGRTFIDGVVDKGADKGAVVVLRREVHDHESGEHLATVGQSLFARGDGGIGSSGQAPPDMGTIPDRAPDAVVDMPVSPRAALIYRLSGDINPLHADPAIAAKAGFERPILHGLATYGVMGHAVLRHACNYEPTRIKSLRGRFSAPVYPGDTISVSMWNVTGGVALTGTVKARDAVVFKNGFAELAD